MRSIFMQPGSEHIKGLVVGRFQLGSVAKPKLLRTILAGIPACKDIPIVTNVDFGHTDPQAVIPLGGLGRLCVEANTAIIDVLL